MLNAEIFFKRINTKKQTPRPNAKKHKGRTTLSRSQNNQIMLAQHFTAISHKIYHTDMICIHLLYAGDAVFSMKRLILQISMKRKKKMDLLHLTISAQSAAMPRK